MAQADLENLKLKFKKEPKKNNKPSWSLNSRHLICHLFYNVLGEKPSKRTEKGQLPSVDAEALEKMKSPIAKKLIQYRSNSKTLKSLMNAVSFLYQSKVFGNNNEDETTTRALLRFNVIGFDNVERIFSVSEHSIPLNVDKRGRDSFVTPSEQIDTDKVISADPRNLSLLEQLFVQSR